MITLLILFIIFCSVMIYRKSKQKKHDDNHRDYYLLLHVLLVQYTDLLKETVHLKSFSDKMEDFNKHLDELIAIYDNSKHGDMVKIAVEEFIKNGYEAPDKQQLRLIEQPLDFDSKVFRYNRYTEIVNSFEDYWETAIANLKQKAAIQKRRQYLIEQIDEMIIECDKYGYNTLISTLQKYRLKNEQALSNS